MKDTMPIAGIDFEFIRQGYANRHDVDVEDVDIVDANLADEDADGQVELEVEIDK